MAIRLNMKSSFNYIFQFTIVIALANLIEASQRPISTYSIVAFDENTGEFGVAVQSHWFSVGSIVPWARSGVGAVATQSLVKVEYGPDGLDRMHNGQSAQEALNEMLSADKAKALRQVAIIDSKGNVAVHTGDKCIQAAGHRVGKNYSVQANMMEKTTVWNAMADAYEDSKGDLAERMMSALEAAEKEGGDIRGKQSASMLVVTGNPTGTAWKDKVLDLRVDDHHRPLEELRRLIRIHRAYRHANQGDHFLEKNKIEEAMIEYQKAASYYPENPELPYWSAVTLARTGDIEKAIPIFTKVFKEQPKLRKLIPRLRDSGLLPDNDEIINKIMKIGR